MLLPGRRRWSVIDAAAHGAAARVATEAVRAVQEAAHDVTALGDGLLCARARLTVILVTHEAMRTRQHAAVVRAAVQACREEESSIPGTHPSYINSKYTPIKVRYIATNKYSHHKS